MIQSAVLEWSIILFRGERVNTKKGKSVIQSLSGDFLHFVAFDIDLHISYKFFYGICGISCCVFVV